MTTFTPKGASALMVVLALALALGAVGASCTVPERPVDDVADRLLILSVPGVGWQDIEAGELPQLARLLERSATGATATRIGRARSDLSAAYLTVGAGSRAVAPPVDAGLALAPGSSYEEAPAAALIERRLGTVPDGITYLGLAPAVAVNERSRYGAEVGTVGDRLAAAGIERAVIANADLGVDDRVLGRSAVTALMDGRGVVPKGEVSRRLTAPDEDAAFGLALNAAAVVDVFEPIWSSAGRVAVLVEASDLVRVEAYRSLLTADHYDRLRDKALTRSDALVAALLDVVGPRDAVLVVAPVPPTGGVELGVVGLRAPGLTGGQLGSATTRRAGFVQLADVGPTILSTLGVSPPDAVEGRPFWVDRSAAADPSPVLTSAGQAAAFRDRVLPATVTGLIAILTALTGAALVKRRLAAPARRVARFVALACLGAVTATFLAAATPVADGPAVAYFALVAGGGLAVAAAASFLERRRPGVAPLVAVAALVAVIAIDVAAGAELQLNAVFGYSAAVAGRFAGLGNLAFALLGASTIVLAALAAERWGRRGEVAAVVLFAVVALVDGLPFFGADVGGLLSLVPAFGATVLVLAGRSLTLRSLIGLLAVASTLVLLFAFIDLARPEPARTHLSRLAQHLMAARWSALTNNLTRRLEASFGGDGMWVWVVLAILAFVTATFLAVTVLRRRGTWASLLGAPRPVLAAGAGLSVLALLGMAANDSSVAVPATMLLVVVPVAARRLLTPAGERQA